MSTAKDLEILKSLLNEPAIQEALKKIKINGLEEPEEPEVQDPFSNFKKIDFSEDEALPDTIAMKSLARKLSFKYADEIPPTLRSGESAIDATQPIGFVAEDSEFSLDKIPTPKIDADERLLHDLSPDKKKLLSALDLMFHAGIVTPIYYQKMRKYLYIATDMAVAFNDMLSIVEDAEKEMQLYHKRLTSVKELLGK